MKQYTPVKVKNVVIGDGYPKICVPIAGRTTDDIIDEANFLKEIGPDVVEWRVDFFKYVKNIDKVKEVLKMIREILYDKPIIFTFRSYSEGGEIEVTREFYIKLNTSVIDTKFVDIVDIELFNDVEDIKQLIKRSHENSVSIIISNHDFNKTPNKYEIISRLCRAQQLGADISKIAVMPNSTKDVITLLDATRIMKEKYAKRPIITMSMAGKGVISRLSGELFGSDMTFGSAKNISAPGQIPIRELRKIINLLHNNL
ncbi:type I 3-dehydroquinate dehydratase [Clostridium tyrobutyricum]|uniref:type I 3-dehydroquinate dehydratase n=1 Tax=Clostridium tyrobutyricum TaxID=1519 RepID=UPI001FAB30B6|nr:type I 3-dehydroquinate dehydratase [Clostridium tyrobutyricum]